MASTRTKQPIVKHPQGFTEIPSHPFIGVDLRRDPKYAKPGSLLVAQNFLPYEQFVADKRRGTIFLNATAWPNVLRVPFAMRFPGAKSKLVCVNKAAGDEIASIDDTTGAYTALTGTPAFSPNTRWRGMFSGETPIAYLGNDVDPIVYTSDGLTYQALTGTQIPDHGYMAGPYFDRIIAYTGKRVYYSRNNDPTNWSQAGGGLMYLFVNGPENITAVFNPGPERSDVAYAGKLYICTPTNTWQHNLDFDESAGTTADTAPSDSFTKIHDSAGIAAPNSVAWCDAGVIGLGIDNVWFFPISGLPYPVGYKIQDLIKTIPAESRVRCSGVFKDGFYYLSYVRSGQTDPDREMVADLRAMSYASEDYGVMWYGPHVRGTMGIECYLLQPRTPDNNELFAFGSMEGRCLQLDTEIYTDGGAAMQSILTPVNLGDQVRGLKGFPGVIVGAEISADDSVDVYYDVDGGRATGVKTLSFTMGGATWAEAVPSPSDAIWDVSDFAGDFYAVVQKMWGDAKPLGSRVRLTLQHTSANRISIKEFSAIANLFGRVTP